MAEGLATWLGDLGLEKYFETFAAHDIDMRALPHLTEADLTQLGVSLGHRKIILAAVATLSSSVTPAAKAVTGPSPPQPETGPQAASEHAERRLVSVLFCD